MRRQITIAFVCVAVIIGIVPQLASATGFAIFTQGGSTLGEAVANTAHVDDPSAIFFNPALINKLPGTQIHAGTTTIASFREFTNENGEKTKAVKQVFFPSTFYFTHALTDRFSVGFGVFNPFGLGTRWPGNWEGRYLATKSEMTTFAFNPVASVRLAPWLTVAGGITYLTLDASFEKHINLGALAPGAPDGVQELRGDGDGFGGNAGLLVEPTENIAIGISYRSKISVDISGDVKFRLPDPAFGGIFPNTDARTSLTLPARVFAGVYFKHLYPFTFEIGTRWEGWSSFKRLTVRLDQPVAGSTVSVTPRDWRDTWTGMLGMRYQLTDAVALQAGYQYSGNAVPDHTFEPAIPDSNSHYFSVGADIRHKAWKVGLGYGYQHLVKRTKNNSVADPITQAASTSANGDYKSALHMLSVNVTYQF